jgi:hypothetical protein
LISGKPALTMTGDITHAIQLAVAPVFVLTAIGTLLNVLAGRLGRAVDRRRALTVRLPTLESLVAGTTHGELAFIARRITVIYAAIALAVVSALLICLVIAVAFMDVLIAAQFARVVAALFVLAMITLIGSLAAFLREIYLGVNTIVAPLR